VGRFADQVLYQQWLRGTLGSTSSATARRFGPVLLGAQTVSWEQARAVRGDPDATRALIAAKQKTWKDAAEQIEADDPDAYEYLTGRRADRTANALWVLAASFTLTLTFLALGLLGACYLVIRFVVMTAPVWAVVAVLPSRRRLLRKASVLVGASVLFGAAMAVLVPVHVQVTGHLLDLDAAPDPTAPHPTGTSPTGASRPSTSSATPTTPLGEAS
jgi:hypothetical protein